MVWRILIAASYFDHLEIFLASPAFGAGPVGRHVLPAGAGRDALFGQPRSLVVDEPADETHVGFVNLSVSCGHAGIRFELESNSIQSSLGDQKRGPAPFPHGRPAAYRTGVRRAGSERRTR